MPFEKLGISAPIIKALKEAGYTYPTAIQKKAIPEALKGKDILGLAQTGTGKTAAFAVPTLQLLSNTKPNKRKIRSLILTPTRELAIQIHDSFKTYGHYLPLKSTVIFGGVGQGKQVNALRSGVDILIATPGRLNDLIGQGYVDLSTVEIFTLDEADRMLDMGFIHDIKKLIKILPTHKQTLLFSATMPKEIQEIVNTLLKDPITVSVSPVSSTVDTIKQYVYFVDKKQKSNLLINLLKKDIPGSVLVFTRTKHGADKVVKDLNKEKITALAIHGNKSQNARQRALQNFKDYKTQVLVATDIASRGIDIHELSHVINYDLPEESESYVHHIGRTGRAGHEGEAISFCSFQEKNLLKDIEKLTQQKIEVLTHAAFPMEDTTPKQKPKQKNTRPKQNNQKRRSPKRHGSKY